MNSVIEWLERRFNLTEIFAFLTNFGLFPSELDTRRPVREAISEALARPLPSYARWPRILGILSLLLFLFLGITGVMLAFYYQPSPSEAYESVTVIVRDVSFGWFVHQIHGWAAQLLLLILLVRVWRFYFQAMYKTPREAFWIVAFSSFVAATHADLTGRLLSWSASGYWSTIRAIEILYALPGFGPIFAFLVGGRDVEAVVLVRFYFLHVAAIPALMLTLFFLNFSAVRRVGLSEVAGERSAGPAAYKRYLLNFMILVLLIFGGLVTLATLIPAPFDRMADPLSTPPGARPPWYLLASHAFLEIFPVWVPRPIRGILLEAILAMSILLPFIDRSAGRTARARRPAIALGVAVLLAWILFTWYGYHLEVGR